MNFLVHLPGHFGKKHARACFSHKEIFPFGFYVLRSATQMRKPRRFALTTGQWLYHCRFKATSLILLAYVLFLAKSIGKLSRNANDAHKVKRRVSEICLRNVYNVSNTCHGSCYAVVVTVNMGFYDFFLNWHHHYTKLNLEDNATPNRNYTTLLVVIAEDTEIYNKLLSYPFNNTEIILGANSVSYAADYDSVAYKSLVSERASHLLNLICGFQPSARNKTDWNGWIVVYSDIDTVWLQDPIPIIDTTLFRTDGGNLQKIPKYDILASIDDHTATHPNYYCTGFLIVASTAHSINFLSQWEQELKSPRLNQPIFNKLIHEQSTTIRHGFLAEEKFPSGKLFFNTTKRETMEEMVVVHNNYIVGREKKRRRFEEYGLWNTTILSFVRNGL
jgi:hypothetical protein